jgi:hypothetical protein
MKTLREGRKGVLNPEQVQWVTSIDTLQSMVHLSLKKRAMIVRDRFQLETFDAMTLRRYYIKFKVKFIRPNYTYWKSFAEKNSLKEKQMVFVQQLGNIIRGKYYDEIIYIDETTFHLWQKLSRCWVTSGMKLSLIKNRGPSITVIGAISRERGLVHFEVFVENNNANLFMNFIQALKNKCQGRRVVVVLDNLRIHHSKKLNEVYTKDFKELFLPTYSSELNPIERLWSIVKRKWT